MDYQYDVMFIMQFLSALGVPQRQQEFSQSREKYDDFCVQRDSINASGRFKNNNARAFVLKGTEEPLVMTSGKKTIHYSMGELMFVNGQWSLFTRQNVDIYIVDP